MNKTSTFIIKNLWWIIPLLVVIVYWEHIVPIILMLIFAYLGCVILTPITILVEKWIGSRKWAVFIIIIILLIIISFLSRSLFPLIGKQIVSFQESLTMETLVKFLNRLTAVMENILPSYIFILYNDFINQFDSTFSEIWALGMLHIKSFIGGAGTLAFTLGSAFLSFLIIIVFMIIFLLDSRKFIDTFLNAFSSKHYKTAKKILDQTSIQINSYIRGQLIAACSVAVTSILGLYFLQWITGISIPYTFLIGVFAGLFNLIPFVGPIMGMIPAVIIYLVTDQIIPIHFVYVFLIIGVFCIVQLIDNLLMSPYIMGTSVGFHPILIIILVLFGASISGIIGMLFAVPIAAIIKVVIVELIASIKK